MYMTPEEIRTKGLSVLKRELGVAGMIRFLQQFDRGNGDGEAGAQEGGADVGVAVVVVPGALVFVVGVVGDEALQGGAEVVLDQAGLEFHGGDGGGGTDDKEMDEAGNAQVGQAFLQL